MTPTRWQARPLIPRGAPVRCAAKAAPRSASGVKACTFRFRTPRRNYPGKLLNIYFIHCEQRSIPAVHPLGARGVKDSRVIYVYVMWSDNLSTNSNNPPPSLLSSPSMDSGSVHAFAALVRRRGGRAAEATGGRDRGRVSLSPSVSSRGQRRNSRSQFPHPSRDILRQSALTSWRQEDTG